MKAYPKYKDSGVPWLGEVPEHWETLKLRIILSQNTKRNHPDLPLLSVVREQGVIKRNTKNKEENHNTIPEDLSNYKVVQVGQFAMNKMKAWQGSYGVSDFNGIVSPAYYVFDINGVLCNFFHLAIRSKAYIPFFTQASDGVRIGQWDLNQTRMREIPFFIPTQKEQLQIARYLDWKTAKIDTFIKAKKKIIALLKEQKQNIITEAVTKGINPNVKMKDSGVEWLGEIPAHWDVAALKHFCKIQNGLTLGANHPVGKNVSRPYLRVANVQNGYFLLDNIKRISLPEQDVWRYELQFGDVLITEGGDLDKLGRGFVWESQIDKCLHQNHIFAVRTNQFKLLPEFLSILLNARPGREYFALNSKKTTNLASTNSSTVKAFLFPLLCIEEQQSIVKHIRKETAIIDKAISRTEQQIKLVQEYRTRLISDVVTGKIDVRSVKIPDTVHERHERHEKKIKK